MHWGGGGALQASQPPEWGLPFFFQRLLAAQPPSSGSPEGKIEVGPQKCQGSGGPFPATEAMPPIRHPWRFVYLFEEDTEGALPGHPGVPWRCPEVGKTEGHEEVGPSRGGQAPLGTGGVMYLIRTEVRQCALSQVPDLRRSSLQCPELGLPDRRPFCFNAFLGQRTLLLSGHLSPCSHLPPFTRHPSITKLPSHAPTHPPVHCPPIHHPCIHLHTGLSYTVPCSPVSPLRGACRTSLRTVTGPSWSWSIAGS